MIQFLQKDLINLLADVRGSHLHSAMVCQSCSNVVTRGQPDLGRSFVLPASWNLLCSWGTGTWLTPYDWHCPARQWPFPLLKKHIRQKCVLLLVTIQLVFLLYNQKKKKKAPECSFKVRWFEIPQAIAIDKHNKIMITH